MGSFGPDALHPFPRIFVLLAARSANSAPRGTAPTAAKEKVTRTSQQNHTFVVAASTGRYITSRNPARPRIGSEPWYCLGGEITGSRVHEMNGNPARKGGGMLCSPEIGHSRNYVHWSEWTSIEKTKTTSVVYIAGRCTGPINRGHSFPGPSFVTVVSVVVVETFNSHPRCYVQPAGCQE